MSPWRQVGRWSAWISLGVILTLLLVAVAQAAPDWAEEGDPSAAHDEMGLFEGVEPIEPSPVLAASGQAEGLLLPRLAPDVSPGRRVVSEIFRPPIS